MLILIVAIQEFVLEADWCKMKHILMYPQPKTSFGYGNCSRLFMKIFGEQIAVPISTLINKSIGERIVSDEINI